MYWKVIQFHIYSYAFFRGLENPTRKIIPSLEKAWENFHLFSNNFIRYFAMIFSGLSRNLRMEKIFFLLKKKKEISKRTLANFLSRFELTTKHLVHKTTNSNNWTLSQSQLFSLKFPLIFHNSANFLNRQKTQKFMTKSLLKKKVTRENRDHLMFYFFPLKKCRKFECHAWNFPNSVIHTYEIIKEKLLFWFFYSIY
jgi:hypothetical protein